jgi:hypothetical protein
MIPPNIKNLYRDALYYNIRPKCFSKNNVCVLLTCGVDNNLVYILDGENASALSVRYEIEDLISKILLL